MRPLGIMAIRKKTRVKLTPPPSGTSSSRVNEYEDWRR